MTRYILCDLRTGGRILDLPVLKGPWDDRLLAAETISVTVDMNDRDVQALDLRNSAAPAKTALCVVENNTIMAGGPVWTRVYDRKARTLTLGAKGMASYFDHRLILPLLAATIGVDQWTVPDLSDPTKTMANPLLSTTINGVSLGTIAKRLVQQARLWTGGNVPIVFQDDEAGTATRTYLGVDFKPLGEALDQLAQVINGPEYNFMPRFTEDGLGVEWLLQTGTIAQPLVTSNAALLWDLTVPESAASGLTLTEDGTAMASLAWQMGGNQSDDVLVARAYDSTLVDVGYPLLETLDSSHTDVSLQSTLDGYAATDARLGRTPSEVWSFTAKANPVDSAGGPSGPLVGSYAVGDFCDLVVAKWNPHTGTGDPYIPGGTYRHRIVGISGDELGVDIKISCAPKVGN